jgi:hypothetical protein
MGTRPVLHTRLSIESRRVAHNMYDRGDYWDVDGQRMAQGKIRCGGKVDSTWREERVWRSKGGCG